MEVKVSIGERCAVAVATGFYLSYIPVKLAGRRTWWTGSGLLGTAQGLALAPLIPRAGLAAAVFLTAAIALSSWISGVAERVLGHHDDQRIILDEIVGFWPLI
ncbi:MAG: phosphatidylglycerophosphatase A [Chloroflexi bacterium]|nr:phosphatidylglycerophosphatase A [Chloroflexota bacterium]